MLLLISFCAILVISHFAPVTPVWNALTSLLISIVASGVFALMSGFFIYYFFTDTDTIVAKSLILPRDIGHVLQDIAEKAGNYKIFVRTGRHFRAEILPMLVKQARRNRRLTQVDVVLLDFRDTICCDRYASYRRSSSFDCNVWDTDYVRMEILATILKLIRVSTAHIGLIEINLFLSKRLSTFRIEGSSDEMIITREDPKDMAARYHRAHPDFAAFEMEFNWICAEAHRVAKDVSGSLPTTLFAMFGENEAITKLEGFAVNAGTAPSPYAR